jgi:ferredoxin
VSCIYIEDETADRMLYINPEECIDCGACEPECPVDAIFEGSAVPSQWEAYRDINAEWFGDKNAARGRVDELKPA